MKKDSLKENIAKILGVSSLEKDLAFEILLEKLTEVLDYDQAIKIPNLGAFQLKKHVLGKDERSLIGDSNQKNDKIIYSAFDHKSTRESNSLFLSFDVKAKSQNEFDFNDEIFSPGVGKPIIPINQENENADSSIHLIKKLLEERVSELIEESEKVDNFDIWDDFYKNVDKENNSEHDNLEIPENNSINFQNESEFEFLDKENVEQIGNSEEINFDENQNTEDDSDDDEFKVFPGSAFGESDDSSESKSFSQDEIDSMLNSVSISDDEDIVDDSIIVEKDLTAFAQLTNLFSGKLDDDSIEETVEDDFDARKINDDVDTEDPFATLEKTFSGEIDDEQANEEDEVDENIEDDIYDVNKNQENDELENNATKQARTIEYSPESDNDIEKTVEGSVKKKFGFLFWGIALLFLIVTIVGGYFLFFNNNDNVEEVIKKEAVISDSLKKEEIVKPLVQKIDSTGLQKDSTVENTFVEKPIEVKSEQIKVPVEKVKPAEPKIEEKPIVKKTETSSSNSSLKPNQNVSDEVEVANFIYSNGSQYSVQVSSWRRKDEAELAALRYSDKGYKTSVVTAQLSKIGVWFRVRVGYFDSLEKAKEFQNKHK